MSPAKKSSPKKTATKQSPAKKAAAKKSVAKKSVAKKSVAKKSVPKRAPAKKAPAKKASAQRATTKKAAPAKKRAAFKRAPVKRAAPTRPAPVGWEAAPEPDVDADVEPEVQVEEPSRLAPPRGPALAGPAGPTAEPYRPTPSTVIVGFDAPGPQRRLTVAFRIILAFPHLILLTLLSIAAFFVVIVGWFAALVLGRLPAGLATFLGNIVEYGARVSAYGLYLLTDRYPPFSFTTPYAVSVDIAPGRLNRAAVFFRLIIAIPAYWIVTIVQYGYQAAAIFIWLIVLVAGRMPTSLWQANAAVLRYITRYYAYLALVTGEYPWGLFGDRE